MPNILTPAAARDHLKVGAEVTDAELEPMIAAAEAAIEGELNRPLIDAAGWATAEAVPANVVHAIKLVLGQLFASRETTVTGTIATEIDIGGKPAIRFLLQRYIRVGFS